jgi:methylenetetrahydrofolate reductase (NADPH)
MTDGAAIVDGADGGDRRSVAVSFEFFPPQSADMDDALWRAVKRLEPIGPRFVSVTYGAGGSTRERTHSTLQRILAETSLTPAAHLTCVGAARADVDEVVRDYAATGIRHIVALRGDPPSGVGAQYEPHPGGYANAAELVGGIRRIAEFEISVAAYPEKHPESATLEVDIAMLQAKIDAGATRAITQFFFDNSAYFRFLDKVRARGIDIPIVPGLLPISDIARVQRFASRCGAQVSPQLAARFEGLEDQETRLLVGAAVAAEQVSALADQGVDEFHFYTLNRAELVYAICRLLGLGCPGDKIAA